MTHTETLLSDAERDVLSGLLDGLTNVQIAKSLRLSDKTVKNHVSHILAKTGYTSRLKLTVAVYKQREKELKRRTRAA
jgi:DNA-binding NarL/FixJ family response regulator